MWNEVETTSTNKVPSDLDLNSSYCFRVQGLKKSVCSPRSKEVVLRTPPVQFFFLMTSVGTTKNICGKHSWPSPATWSRASTSGLLYVPGLYHC